MTKPRVLIVSPGLAADNNGNWRTAARWARHLAGAAQIQIKRSWDGSACEAMIALHARRSADSIARLSALRPEAPIGLVLTGTDVYRDIRDDRSAQHSLQCASQLVVLQPDALNCLDEARRAKARVIVQSATAWRARPSSRHIHIVAVGHLREEKDPATLMAATSRLRGSTRIQVIHIGDALSPDLAQRARETMAACTNYHWLGGLPRKATRGWIARAHALVHMSRLEGGAQAIIEAVRSGVPVLASHIGGNVGLLGENYAGYFEVGNSQALAWLIDRIATEPGFAALLATQCALREHDFRPETEQRLVRQLLADLLASQGAPSWPGTHLTRMVG